MSSKFSFNVFGLGSIIIFTVKAPLSTTDCPPACGKMTSQSSVAWSRLKSLVGLTPSPPPVASASGLRWKLESLLHKPAPPSSHVEQLLRNPKGLFSVSVSEDRSGWLLYLVPGLLVLALLFWILFVPPRRLHHSINNVPIISSRFPGLGAIGFFANRYTL